MNWIEQVPQYLKSAPYLSWFRLVEPDRLSPVKLCIGDRPFSSPCWPSLVPCSVYTLLTARAPFPATLNLAASVQRQEISPCYCLRDSIRIRHLDQVIRDESLSRYMMCHLTKLNRHPCCVNVSYNCSNCSMKGANGKRQGKKPRKTGVPHQPASPYRLVGNNPAGRKPVLKRLRS